MHVFTCGFHHWEEIIGNLLLGQWKLVSTRILMKNIFFHQENKYIISNLTRIELHLLLSIQIPYKTRSTKINNKYHHSSSRITSPSEYCTKGIQRRRKDPSSTTALLNPSKFKISLSLIANEYNRIGFAIKSAIVRDHRLSLPVAALKEAQPTYREDPIMA